MNGQQPPDRRGSALAWAVLAVLGLLMLCVGLVATRARPRPFMTQSQIEQQGLQDGRVRGIGTVQQVTAHSTTLGRLRPNLRCGYAELAYRTLLVAARIDSYNPCDPSTRLWVVELRGNFATTWSAQPVRFFYTAAGEYIRTEGGP
jgi:hypothetical protein